jgi:hypothetical protein
VHDVNDIRSEASAKSDQIGDKLSRISVPRDANVRNGSGQYIAWRHCERAWHKGKHSKYSSISDTSVSIAVQRLSATESLHFWITLNQPTSLFDLWLVSLMMVFQIAHAQQQHMVPLKPERVQAASSTLGGNQQTSFSTSLQHINTGCCR